MTDPVAADVADLPAGPDMDRAIAELVMGWTMAPHPRGLFMYQCWCINGDPLHTIHGFAPSTKIAHAWDVVEHLAARGIEVRIRNAPPGPLCKTTRWVANVDGQAMNEVEDTAPLAICRAALRAVRR